MKKFFILILFCILVTSILASPNKVISQQLQQKLQLSENNEFIRINISLMEQYDSDELMRNVQFQLKDEKKKYVISELQNFSRRTQENILTELDNFQNIGNVKEIIPLWITNMINCYATPSVIEELSTRNNIKSIDWDEMRNMLINDNKKEQKILSGNQREREITWNVTKVNADDVWGLGYTGDGILVAVLDTGVRYTHHDLEDHVWNGSGAGYPNHGYDFVNSDYDPIDDHGHGTHCAGTVAGDGTAGSQTGMAPDATIMCLKVLDSDGSGTESGVWNAIQFCVTHDVDIMSMSIGWQHSWGVDRESWRDAMNNAVSAGVIAAVAAGNEGDELSSYPIPDNVRTPGDVPPPWLHPDQTLTGGTSAVVCVGAVDSSDNIAYFSSLGPLDWSSINDYWDYHYNPEMGLIRPDIVAPGMNIKSLDYGSDTGYADGWNGTSMATPCVAGVMALMLEKNPTITPAQIDQYLEETVDIPQSPKNNTYGSGRVDALDVVNAVPFSGNPFCNIINPSNGEVIEIGSIVTITVDASDPSRSVSNVKIYIDDVLKITDYSAPYQYIWDTTGETLDYHTIKAAATDNELNETEDIITVRVANPTVNIFEDDFETNNGWMLTGEFERNAPGGLGGDYGNPDPASAHGGSYVLGVDLTGLGTYSGDYEINLADRAYTATSPIINCTDCSNVQMPFWRYRNVEQPTYDHAYIDMYDGSTWQQIWTNSAVIEESSWSEQNIDISTYADGNTNMRIRFCIGSTDGSWQYSGWNIDDFVVFGESTIIIPNEPINVTISIVGSDLTISWDVVSGAISYKVYSSDDPYTGFVEDTSGSFAGESWSTSIINEKKFYYIKAIN